MWMRVILFVVGGVFCTISVAAWYQRLSVPTWQLIVLVGMLLVGLWLCFAAVFAGKRHVEWLLDRL